MANKQPTCQQLAYLGELKQRLQELRLRQETFMEETAEILRKISSDRPAPIEEEPSTGIAEPARREEEAESVGNIKQLIQRFEDLRQTSRQFSDQAMPEELLGVDVRKLLKGYENLIVEGCILHKNWMLLKKTTESCARHGNCDEDKLELKSSKSPSFAEQLNEVLPRASKSFSLSLETTTHAYYDEFHKNKQHFEKLAKSPSKFNPKIIRCQRSKQINFNVDCEQQSFNEHVRKKSQDTENGHRQRFGAILQLMLRANPFKKCANRNTTSLEEIK